jgi:endonuclease-3
MRTSRISQETSRALNTTSRSSTTRTTRSSLAQFAHNATKLEETSTSTSTVTDIEDIIPSAPSRVKRKRGATVIKNELTDTVTLPNSPPAKIRKQRQPARKIKTEDGGAAVQPPSDWEDIYATVMDMRKHGPAANAAVDTMGCDSLALPTASPRDQRFHTLIALMMSSQTKDTTNAVAMQRLQTSLPPYKPGAPPGLNLENILAVDPKVLNEMIWVVGFHNNKTKYIKAAAEILRDQYDGDIPDTVEGLMSLPGVGPKMAYLCMSSAWGRDEGIGVDVHVHRITNLWGWNKTKGPEETRIALQSWLPREKWHEINWLLVGLGQTVCAPQSRKCGECDVGLKGLCKAADRGKLMAARKVKEEIVQSEIGESVKVKKIEELVILKKEEDIS